MKHLSLVLVLTLLTSTFVCALPAEAQTPLTLTLSAAKDNTLYENIDGALSNGSGDYLFAGNTAQGTDFRRRALLAFDVANCMPEDATIQSAELHLTMSQTIVGAMDIDLRPVSQDWGESTSHADGQEGGGAPSAAGDATWIHAFFNTASWINAGGDFGTVSATTSVDANGPYTWASTPDLVADVQGWLNTPSSNYGWILVGNETTISAKRFNSRENLELPTRPTLTVTFTSPTAVFIDGFEAGDCSAWSAGVPSSC